MSNNDLKDVLGWSAEERFDFFLDQVVEEKEIWILVNDENQFLKLYSEEDGLEYLPVWPRAEFAADYSSDTDDLQPKSVPLPQFLKKWVSGLTKDGLEIGVFPGADDTLWVTGPAELESDLQEALSAAL